MTDFVFLVSPQEIATACLVVVFFLVGALAFLVLWQWVAEMIENYGDGLDDWHVNGERDRER